MRSPISRLPRLARLGLAFAISLSLSGSTVAQDPSSSGPDGEKAPAADAPPWEPLLETLRSGTLPEKGQIVDRLLGAGDVGVLVPLREALGEEDRALRVRITTGILRSYPQEAADFFFGLFDDQNLHRREAGVFAIGAIEDPRVMPTLLPLLEDPNQTLSEAAARSILQRGRQSANAAYAQAIGSTHPQAENLRRLYRDTATAVSEYALEHSMHSDLGRMLFRRFADGQAAERFRERAVEAAPDDPGLAAVRDLGRKVAHWSPRAALPGEGTLNYTMQIQNVFIGSEKIVRIGVESTDFRTLHFWGYSLDRAVRCDLPLDVLLLDPSVCSPKWLESESGSPMIEYRLPERTTLQAGIGILNIAFWSASISSGRRVLLELDRESGRPARERVYSDAGELVFEVSYQDYGELSGDRVAPMKLAIRVPAAPISGKEVPLRHEFRFRTTADIWHFEGGETYAWETSEAGEESEVLRAVGFIESPTWTPKATPAVEKPTSEATPGKESGKQSGAPKQSGAEQNAGNAADADETNQKSTGAGVGD